MGEQPVRDRQDMSSNSAKTAASGEPAGEDTCSTGAVAPPARRPKAGNSEGSIRRLPSGKYGMRVQLGLGPDGKPIRPHVTGATKLEVRRLRSELLARHRAGLRSDPKAERQSLAAYLTVWLDGKRGTVEPSTWVRYQYEIQQRLIPTLGQLPLGAITPADIRRAYRKMLDGTPPLRRAVAARTVEYAHVTLHQALAQAVSDGSLHRNVADVVDPPKVVRSEARALTPEEIRRLLATAEGDWHALWTLALYSGMREGELLGLTWADLTCDGDEAARSEGAVTVQRVLVEDEAGMPFVRPYPKSRSGIRTIPIPVEVLDLLRVHRRRQLLERARSSRWEDALGLVFLSRWGTPLLRSNVRRSFKRDAGEAGIQGRVTPHDLRHTFASHLLLAGRPITEVSYFLGHASAAVTLGIYAHWVRTSGSGAAHALAASYRSHSPHDRERSAPAV
jgi:integrase